MGRILIILVYTLFVPLIRTTWGQSLEDDVSTTDSVTTTPSTTLGERMSVILHSTPNIRVSTFSPKNPYSISPIMETSSPTISTTKLLPIITTPAFQETISLSKTTTGKIIDNKDLEITTQLPTLYTIKEFSSTNNLIIPDNVSTATPEKKQGTTSPPLYFSSSTKTTQISSTVKLERDWSITDKQLFTPSTKMANKNTNRVRSTMQTPNIKTTARPSTPTTTYESQVQVTHMKGEKDMTSPSHMKNDNNKNTIGPSPNSLSTSTKHVKSQTTKVTFTPKNIKVNSKSTQEITLISEPTTLVPNSRKTSVERSTPVTTESYQDSNTLSTRHSQNTSRSRTTAESDFDDKNSNSISTLPMYTEKNNKQTTDSFNTDTDQAFKTTESSLDTSFSSQNRSRNNKGTTTSESQTKVTKSNEDITKNTSENNSPPSASPKIDHSTTSRRPGPGSRTRTMSSTSNDRNHVTNAFTGISTTPKLKSTTTTRTTSSKKSSKWTTKSKPDINNNPYTDATTEINIDGENFLQKSTEKNPKDHKWKDYFSFLKKNHSKEYKDHKNEDDDVFPNKFPSMHWPREKNSNLNENQIYWLIGTLNFTSVEKSQSPFPFGSIISIPINITLTEDSLTEFAGQAQWSKREKDQIGQRFTSFLEIKIEKLIKETSFVIRKFELSLETLGKGNSKFIFICNLNKKVCNSQKHNWRLQITTINLELKVLNETFISDKNLKFDFDDNHTPQQEETNGQTSTTAETTLIFGIFAALCLLMIVPFIIYQYKRRAGYQSLE